MAWSLVGTIGAVSTAANNTAVTPAWGTGESRTAGNLLICWVAAQSAGGGTTPPATPSGWSIGAQQAGTGPSATVFYKTAAGADAAPSIAASAAYRWTVMLGEFTGGSSSVDSSGLGAVTTTSPIVATASAADAASGDLVLACGSISYTSAATKTITQAFNNATATTVTDAATSTLAHSAFSYATTTTNAGADTSTLTFTTTGVVNATNVVVSFATTATVNGTGTGAITFAGTGTATVSVIGTGTGAIAFGGSGSAMYPSSFGTVFYNEPFEILPSWASGVGTLVSGTRTGGSGSNTMQILGSAGSAVFAIPSVDRQKRMYVDVWWQTSVVGGSTRTIFQLCSPAGTPVLTVEVNAFSSLVVSVNVPGSGDLIVTGTNPTIVVNTWYHLQCYFLEDASAGNARLWLNGTQITTDFAMNTHSGVVESLVLTGNGGGTATNTFDDMVVSMDLPGATNGSGAIAFGGSGTATVTGPAAPTGTGAINFSGTGTITFTGGVSVQVKPAVGFIPIA